MQDAILAEGIQQFCDDLGVDPADIVMLVISWHLSAAAMGEYSSAEFEQVATSVEASQYASAEPCIGCAVKHCYPYAVFTHCNLNAPFRISSPICFQ